MDGCLSVSAKNLLHHAPMLRLLDDACRPVAASAQLVGRISGIRQGKSVCLALYYINPVKHGLVGQVQDWPHSSFHRDVRAGIFPEDWAGEIEIAGKFGERS
jgi:hypothetical protein